MGADQQMQGGHLGINARFASPPHRYGVARVERFILQSMAKSLLPGERVSKCLRVPYGKPEVWYSSQAERSHYKKLCTCGSVWVCAPCASKITERRRLEVEQGIQSWQGSVFMVTFTEQHSSADHLPELLLDLNEGMRRLKSGKWWERFERRYSIAGSIDGLEVTYCRENGYHPHKHLMFFSRLAKGDISREAIEDELSEHFINIMAKRGKFVSAKYGVMVSDVLDPQVDQEQALKAYVSKWGLAAELTKSPVKKANAEDGLIHYSPFELLSLGGYGSSWAASAFVEYAKAMKGRKQLVWSRGLRAALGLLKPEASDEELAQEQTSHGDALLAKLEFWQWKVVLGQDARGELLQVADSGDPEKVFSFLADLGADEESRFITSKNLQICQSF